MPLELIIGRANTGKTGAAYGAIRDALKDGQTPVLVVPSIPDVERARRDFALESALGLSITTFGGLIEELWARHGDGRSIVAQATKSLLLAASLRASGLETGYRHAVVVMIDALMEQTGHAWRERAPLGGEPVELAIAHYARLLDERGLLGPAEAAHLLASGGDVTERAYVFHRFDDFALSQIALVRACAERAPVHVSLTWEEGFAPSAALDSLIERLGATKRRVLQRDPYNTPSELRQVADALFGAPQVVEPTGAVGLGIAEGERAHAELVVDAVAEALDGGVEADRIVVTLRSPERHYNSLRTAFLQAGIDADFDVDLALSSTAFGSAVIEAIKGVAHADAAAVMTVLRTPYSGVEVETARELEARVRGRGVESAFGGTALHQGTLAGVVKSVGRLQRGSGSWTEIADAVQAMYAACWRGETSLDAHAALDAKALRAVLSAIEAAMTAGVDSDVADVLAVLEEMKVHTGGVGSGGVQVVGVTRLRGQRYDTVIVAGLNAGEFPATPDETGLPGSRMHELVKSLGGQGIEHNGADFEDLLFYETITRATRRVVLVGRVADDDGEDAALSTLWEQVADFYAPDREAFDDIPGLARRALAQPPSESGRGREVLQAKARAGQADDPRVAAALRRSSGRPGTLTRAVGGIEVVSASQIETYLSCPYRWFYDRAVGASELETSFGAQQEGSLAHDLLKRAYEALLAAGHDRVTPGNLPEALSHLDAALAEHETREPFVGLPARVGARMVRRWVARILEQDAEDTSGFVPWGFEHAFGFESDPVDLGGFGLRGLVDRIDADADGHALVTDYKRSAKSGLNGAGLLEKRAVQVLLYMEAVERSTGLRPVAGVYRGLKESRTTGVVDESTDAAPLLDRKKAGMSESDLAGLRSSAIALSAEAVEGMRRGHVPPEPLDRDACAFCGAKHVCGEAL